jgi:hypothetical protein
MAQPPDADEPLTGLSDGDSRETNESRRPLASGFLLSLAVHGLVLFVFSLVVLVAETLEEEAPPVKIAQIDAPPPRENPPNVQRDVIESQVTVDIEAESDVDKASPISQLDVPVKDAAQREEDNDHPVPKGREEAVSDSEMGGQGAFMAIGAGGGAGGMFGSRSGGGKKRALGHFGGSKASESAVDAALRWFKKHQGPDGQWALETYQNNCTEAPKCEPGQCPWGTVAGANNGCTGYALLCYLGAGYDHRMPSKYRQTVQKGIDWLVAQQKPDGSFGRNYEQGIATMALAEAYAMTNDPALKDPAQRGVNVIMARQVKTDANDPYSALAWDYQAANLQRTDASVTGWCVMALKSARAAGLDCGESMAGVTHWLKLVWQDSNPTFATLDPYKDTSRIPYAWNPTTKACDFRTDRDLTCVGALCAIFLGHHQGDIMLETMCNHILNKQLPTGTPTNFYYVYYNTLTMFQMGGDRWEKWNRTVRDLLVGSQRKGDGCFDGSWNPADGKFIGFENGRILTTAYGCLSLEVYYRYLPVGLRDHQ